MTILFRTDAMGRRTRGVLAWCGRLAAWTVIAAVVVVLALAVVIPRLGGATPYTILTGSMRPGMPPGTLVVSKPVKAVDVGIGTVITYQLKSGEPTVVTHRVIGLSEDRSGKPIFRMQGDANPTPDPTWVRAVQIRGERWYDVPYLGYLNTYITGTERHIAMIIVISGLLLYAVFMFTSSARDRFGRSRHRLSERAQ